MKKILCFICAIGILTGLLCRPASVFAAEQPLNLNISSLTFDSEKGKIAVTGTVTQAKERDVQGVSGAYVAFNMRFVTEDVAGAIYGAGQVQTNNSGTFMIDCTLSSDAPSGNYKIVIGTEGDSNIYTKNIKVSNRVEVDEAKVAFNHANAGEIHSTVLEYVVKKGTLELPISDNQAVQSDVERILLALRETLPNKMFSTIDDINVTYYNAVAIAAMNSSAADDIGKAISDYNETFYNLNILGDYKKSAAITTETHRVFICLRNANLPNKRFTYISELPAQFDTAVAIAVVNNTSRGEMDQVLHQYNNIFQLDLDGDYSKLDKVEADKALTGMGFDSVAEIQNAFQNKVNILKNPKGTGSKTASGGGVIKTVDIVLPETNSDTDENMFSDIQNIAWAREGINKLSEAGIINGYGDHTFRPDQEVTRGEFVKMLAVMFSLSDNNAEAAFSDVRKDDWYYGYIAGARQAGIVQGDSDGTFGVNNYINRQEMATILFRAIQFKNIVLPVKISEKTFQDADNIDTFAVEGVNRLKEAGIVNGYEDGCFYPNKPVTRAEAAKMLYEIKKLLDF